MKSDFIVDIEETNTGYGLCVMFSRNAHHTFIRLHLTGTKGEIVTPIHHCATQASVIFLRQVDPSAALLLGVYLKVSPLPYGRDVPDLQCRIRGRQIRSNSILLLLIGLRSGGQRLC